MLNVGFEYANSIIVESFKMAFVDAFSRINPDDSLLKMSVFYASDSEETYFENLNFINKEVQEKFRSNSVDISFVAQKPLDAELVIEIVQAKNGSTVSYSSYDGINYSIVEKGDEKAVFLSGIVGEKNQSVSQQSMHVFKKIDEILKSENMPVSSIVRQWNFIPGITQFENGFQHYQQFNDARTLFYNTTNWLKGYPAATGIGTSNAPLLVDIIAMKGHQGEYPIMNSNQIDAHVYSDEVLLGTEDNVLKQRSTPKFERAKLILEKTDASVFISGTAAIIGEESLAIDNAVEQTNITIDNIKNLVSKEALCFCEHESEPVFEFMRVYIKNESDFNAVKQVCERRFPLVHIVYVEADICRDELLVEIEAFVKIRK